jgi:Ca-activated chloride channel family protein
VLHRRLVRNAVLIIVALGYIGVTCARSPFKIVSPDETTVLVGKTLFAFEVEQRDPPVTRIDIYVGGVMVGAAFPPEWKLVWDAGTDNGGKPVAAVAFADDRLLGKEITITRQIAAMEQVSARLVQLYPVVLDRRGRYVHGLTSEDFIILDQGERVEIERFSTGEADLAVALAIDVSKSMENLIGHVQAAACNFTDQLLDGDRVALFAFNNAVRRVVPLSNDKNQIKNGILSLQPSGGTAVYDAIAMVLDDFREVRGRKAILLYSDGKDELSMHSLTSVIQKARASDVVIHSVTSLGADDLEAWANPLTKLADETGGITIRVRKPAKVGDAYQELLIDLRSQYLIAYKPPPGARGLRTVEVKTTKGNYTIRSRKSYDYSPE